MVEHFEHQIEIHGSDYDLTLGVMDLEDYLDENIDLIKGKIEFEMAPGVCDYFRRTFTRPYVN